jgi:hypothetical protein
MPTAADAGRLFAALAEGGQVQMPLGKTFWFPRFGVVADLGAGHSRRRGGGRGLVSGQRRARMPPGPIPRRFFVSSLA